MGYNLNTPGELEPVSISQRKMRNNSFTQDDVFGQDHYKFSQEEDLRGKHKRMILPIQGSDPTIDPGELSLFARDNGGNNVLSVKNNAGDISNLAFEDAAGNTLPQGSMVLAAGCLFDVNGGQIINDKKHNIASTLFSQSTVSGTTRNEIRFDFITPLPDGDYMIVISSFPRVSLDLTGYITIKPNATYSNSVNENFIILENIVTGNFGIAKQVTLLIWVVQ